MRELYHLGPNERLINVLTQLIPEELQEQWMEQLEGSNKGVPDTFIDSLPRVNKAHLENGDECAICCNTYLDDEYPLVVELPYCHHKYDLECLSIWLSKSTTCPICRDEVMSHKIQINTSNAELEEDWGMYG